MNLPSSYLNLHIFNGLRIENCWRLRSFLFLICIQQLTKSEFREFIQRANGDTLEHEFLPSCVLPHTCEHSEQLAQRIAQHARAPLTRASRTTSVGAHRAIPHAQFRPRVLRSKRLELTTTLAFACVIYKRDIVNER